MKAGDFGVTIFYGHQPLRKRCAECPFTASESGHDYLKPGRLDDIKFAVSLGQFFPCHKTVYRDEVPEENDSGDKPSWHPSYRTCAGALEYAEQLASDLGVEPHRIGKPHPKNEKQDHSGADGRQIGKPGRISR
ncbi:hypothetical protein HW571_26610 [Agrobacterium genomosp. 3]|uniref:hypothetical protein n=1 Tax=Agrobacterium tomkonis TaxID=1183410 RepID=UPI001CD864AB|nr:hypothetical protein [Agrobacterium tomkonis]MCA1879596.1 hypothetical protein [Agrobacterium tumefaciens]MCA1894814.1 hypothetical protein [Agrobacterium tomkonis]